MRGFLLNFSSLLPRPCYFCLSAGPLANQLSKLLATSKDPCFINHHRPRISALFICFYILIGLRQCLSHQNPTPSRESQAVFRPLYLTGREAGIAAETHFCNTRFSM